MKLPPRGAHPRRPVERSRLGVECLEPRDVPAAIGSLDPSFGTGGKVTVDFMANESAAAVLLTDDGKTVVVGTTDAGSADVAIARLNADGTLDTTFGSGGRFTFSLGGKDFATDAVLQPDGNIVVVGYSDVNSATTGPNDFAVARVLADGSGLDSSFGTSGQTTIDFGADDRASAVALRSDGRVVVAGFTDAGSADFAVAQLGTDGKLDTSFGSGTGKFSFSVGGKDFANDLAIQSDGNVVVVGYTDANSATTGPNDFAVARVLANGSGLDNTFGAAGNGIATVDFTNDDRANAVALRPDGRIVVVGSWDGGFPDYAIAQLTTGGVLDTSFGGGFFPAGSGKFNVSFGSGMFGQAEFATDVAVRPDGKLIVVGRTDHDVAGGPNNFGVAQVLADGTGLDTLFGGGGRVQVDFNGDDRAEAVAVNESGRVTVAGTTNTGNFAVARIIDAIERPKNLSVGGSATATAKQYVPDATGKYSNPPILTTAATVFPGFAGDVRTATGDFNADGILDTVLVTGPGTKTVMAVVSGSDGSVLLPATDPFGDANFTFGGFVAAGDIDGDGRAEWVITPELRGGPRVIIFHLLADGTFDVTSPQQRSLVANFFGIGDPTFRDGDRAALGDINGDGVLDVFSIAAFNGGPRTALYDGKDVLVARSAGRDPVKLVGDFFATTTGTGEGRGGRSIAVGDVNGDGVADLIVTGDNLLGTGNRIAIFNGADIAAGTLPGLGATVLADFAVGGQPGSALVSVAAVDADGDGQADLAVGSGPGQSSLVRVYLGKNLTGTAEPTSTSFDPFGSTTINGVFVG